MSIELDLGINNFVACIGIIFLGVIFIFKLTTVFLSLNKTFHMHNGAPGRYLNGTITTDSVSIATSPSPALSVGTPTVIPEKDKVVPLSVNFHFTRKCNYKCGFCFHTAKNSFVLPLDTAKRGLQMLKEAGMEKINFSGGEPFIVKRGTVVGEMVRYCKETLQLPSVSIVSNGSLVKEDWFKKYGQYLDILAVSCDSFDLDTNEKIGRQHGQKNHLNSLLRVRRLCLEYKVAFKLNTVVNTYNKNEDMTDSIKELDPCRWKVFQCLLIDGENAGQDALRNAETFVISNEDFDKFLEIHKSVRCLVPESNQKMQNSYLILDEYMRFLDCTRGAKEPSRSLLDVGVNNALKFSGFDEKMFFKRGGKYVWSKSDMNLEW
ncbi:S-adenosylmethionine-dependent nucleotide dehydratase RSAD2-like [Ruditapes philippinarum]|uniref:S-adenosylmethionine-dependent nucleotide dehydratase RSAD2-like n=1 Tax=Ruditapes philippinarum TaxID=129788 RepID=UPI00295AD084|nr:S-adenosylmethionine-dependent nucleotide dehydratase RSAD2-like [Ruditapes philippinarum]